MYHSITFGDKNTWDDWRLVPSSRPVFAPPAQKTTLIDLPGANGALDLSEALTRYPIFRNREGDIEFYVMNDYVPWDQRYSEIMNYLHGREMRAFLEDDPNYFYQGRFTVSEWRSDPNWSKIVIHYTVGPYKWFRFRSIDDWEWDPFNFETGIIWTDFFREIPIDSDSYVDKEFMGELFEYAPVSPEFLVSSSDGNGMDAKFVNPALNIDEEIHLKDGTNFVPDFVFYGLSSYVVSFKGHGTVSMIFRSGRL